MFTGTSHTKADAKRRFSVPSRFLKLLPEDDTRLCVVAAEDSIRAYSALTMYAPYGEQELSATDRHLEMEPSDPERLLFFGSRAWVQPDDHGRILIPKKMDVGKVIKPRRKVSIVGNGDHLYITTHSSRK